MSEEEDFKSLLLKHKMARIPCRNGTNCKWFQQGRCAYNHDEGVVRECIIEKGPPEKRRRTLYEHEPIGDPGD